MLRAGVFGFSERDNVENMILCNYIFLILKLYLYPSGKKKIFEYYELGESDKENQKIEKENPLYSEKILRIIKNVSKQI